MLWNAHICCTQDDDDVPKANTPPLLGGWKGTAGCDEPADNNNKLPGRWDIYSSVFMLIFMAICPLNMPHVVQLWVTGMGMTAQLYYLYADLC